MTVAVIYGMHVLIMRANEFNPPKLSADRFLIMIFFYLCGLGWWTIAFLRHFEINELKYCEADVRFGDDKLPIESGRPLPRDHIVKCDVIRRPTNAALR